VTILWLKIVDNYFSDIKNKIEIFEVSISKGNYILYNKLDQMQPIDDFKAFCYCY